MILLDTHAWIWMVDDPENLSAKALDAIDEARKDSAVYVSSISTWEVYMLASKGRLSMRISTIDWVRKCESLSFLNFVPLDNEIARQSIYLPGDLHSDPADRIIIATARTLSAPIVTKDKKILDYAHVRSIW